MKQLLFIALISLLSCKQHSNEFTLNKDTPMKDDSMHRVLPSGTYAIDSVWWDNKVQHMRLINERTKDTIVTP